MQLRQHPDLPKNVLQTTHKAILHASRVQRQTLEMSDVEPAALPQLGPQVACNRFASLAPVKRNVRQAVRHLDPLDGRPAREAHDRPYEWRYEMSDISPDENESQTATPNLSDISPGASQMSDILQPQTPAPMSSRAQSSRPHETPPASLSDILPPPNASQTPTRRITVRLPTADLTALDARADALNASRSDYLRTLVALPVTLDLSSICHATPGTESLTRPLGPDLALTSPVSQTDSLAVQAITDSTIESISGEVRAIGVNYNQAVRALNRILKKYGNHRALSQDERTEIVELYERLAKQNKAIYERLKVLASDVEALSAKPSVNLTAVGLAQSEAPANKYEPERRRRVRGKKHGSPRPDRSGEEGNA